jgi:hypothetical protein
VPVRALSALLPTSGELAGDALHSAVFRFFTLVDERDSDRLERLGYQLPSLSVGDLVTIVGVPLIVAAASFESLVGHERLKSFIVAMLTAKELA